MKADLYNMKMLSAGTGWRDMSTAPRDGTWVELECSYGVAPWYCIARWTNQLTAHYPDGQAVTFTSGKYQWEKPGGGGPASEGSLRWRTYTGDPKQYVDPTGGAQDSAAYWRGAIAARHGLPLTALEHQAEKNFDFGAPMDGTLEDCRAALEGK